LSGFSIVNGYRPPTSTEGNPDENVPESPAIPSPTPSLGTAVTLPIRRLRRSPTVYDENHKLFVPYIELDAQVGVGDSSGEEENTNPEFLIKKSSDGGFTWKFERHVSMGQIGKYGTRVRLNRWGSGHKLVWEIVTSTSAYPVINDLYFTVFKGEDES
jgi:hypothetical protein